MAKNSGASIPKVTSSDMLEVVALLQDELLPSDRFRVSQNIPYLAEFGIRVKSYTPLVSPSSRLPGRLGRIRERYLLPVALAKLVFVAACRIPGTLASYKADLTWIGRSYVPGLEGLVQLVKAPRVLDVDDAIWMTTPFGCSAAARFARKMDAVIASNDFIADWYSQHCRSVYVVPNGIDTSTFKPSDMKSKSDKDSFVVGWTGTSVNFHELYRIEPALKRFLIDHPKAQLRIISNAKPQFKMLPNRQFEFRQWTKSREGSDLSDLDVGLMPLGDNEWTNGKNSNKMLCYMASGLPVVVSPVGTNKEILTLGNIGLAPVSVDDWYDCLTQLFNDRGAGFEMGAKGRGIVEREFSIGVVSGRLADIFHEIAG